MHKITFQQIEIFLTVAKCLNLTKAAETMYISQPALSKTLQRFEEGTGLQLFTRNNHGVTLTMEGEYLYSTLEPIYLNLDRAINMAQSISVIPPKTLRIVEPSSYDANDDFSEVKTIIRKFEEKYPDIVLVESLCDFKELRQALELGDADFVVSQDFGIADIQGITWKRVSKFELFLAMAADHPLAVSEVLPCEELSQEYFYRVPVLGEHRDTESTTARCRRLGFMPKGVKFPPNFVTLVHMIREKKGMSFCGRFTHICEEGEIRYFPLPASENNNYVVVAWRNGKMSNEAHKFVNMLSGDEYSANQRRTATHV